MKNYKFMKKLLVLALILIASSPQLWAATKRIYFDVSNLSGWWTNDGYTAYIHIGNGTGTTTWPGAEMTSAGSNVYYYDINTNVTQIVFCRAKNGSYDNSNQTHDIDPSSDNYFKIQSSKVNNKYYADNSTTTVAGGYVYFDAYASSGWSAVSDVQLFVGHNSCSKKSNMTNIGNTKLWYVSAPIWPDATEFAFTNGCSGWGDANQAYYDRIGSSTFKSAKVTSYNLNAGSAYIFKVASTANKAAVNSTSPYGYKGTAYTSLNDVTLTIKEKYSSDGVESYTEVTSGTAHGSISASGYVFDSWTTCAGTATGASIAKETSAYSSSSTFGHASTVTLTAGATKAGKAFEGWYKEDGTEISASTSTTITVSADETVYAYYKDEITNDVAISYQDVSTSASIKTATKEEAVGVTTTRSVTAPTIDHYRFSGWTKGTGVSIVTGTTSTPTITINSVEGEDEEDYYLIANYKHLTRYYFTNVSWEHVYAYMWDDDNKSKINATWPGVEITGKTKSEIACGTRYYYELDASVGDSALYDHIIFNEGSGEGKVKTGDLTIDGNADKLFVYGDTWYDLSDHSVAVTTPYSYMGSVSGGGTAKAYGCSAEITATPAEGYRFDSWEVTSGTASIANASSATTTVNASMDATIKANFTQSGMIYFDNTMSQWKGDIYVYLFTNSSTNPWWNTMDGAGNGPGIVLKKKNGDVLYNYSGKMTRIGSSDIYYFDYRAAGCSSTIYKVVFTKGDQSTSAGLYKTSAAYRTQFPECFPMYLASKDWSTTNETGYHSTGYWKKYNVTTSGFDIRGLNDTWTADLYQFTSLVPNSNTFKTKVHLNAKTHSFKIYRCFGDPLGNTGTMTANNHSGWEMTETSDCHIVAPAGGDYEFTINLGTDHIYLSVEYPLLDDDYRLLYTGRITTDGSDSHLHPSKAIRHLTTASSTQKDTVSFFIDKDHKGTINLQYCTDASANSGQGSWANVTSGGDPVTLDLSGVETTGVYSFVITQTTTAGNVRSVSAAPLAENFKYTGNLYIRTDVADGGWEAYKEVENNILEYSDYSKSHSGYDYYHVHWTPTSKNLHFTIANDYSPSISDTMTTGASPFTFDALPYQASVRFMYNSATNKLDRAYLNGSTEGGDATYLMLKAKNDSISETNNAAIGKDGDALNSTTFEDLGNWVYQKDLKAIPGTHVRLISNYYYSSTPHYQYFKGSNSGTWNNASTEQIIGGTGEAQTLRLVYDYKTNHLVSAWLAPTTGATPDLALYADVMIIREEQKDARQIYFTSDDKLTEVDTVYAVMQFNKYSLNNRTKANDGDSTRAEALRNIYWISFPFDVKLNDVFGFGTYGTHWGIEYYDGADRADKGYWADSEGFWKLVTPEERLSFVLKANVGYLLVLDLDLLDTGSKVWEYTDNVSLYFPSKDKVGSIQQTNKTIPIDQEGYLCSIDRRTDKSVANVNKDRRIADSYWHVIGVPSYANKTRSDMPTSAPTDPIWTSDVLYLYVWDGATSTYTVNNSASVTFKTMYSYMVQYSGATISWTDVSATPDKQAIIARKQDRTDYDLRLELRNGDKKEDQTYVRMTDNANVTNAFEFNYDLFKETNKGKANIWTVTSDVVPAAGNVMPFSENTTIVPVGVMIATNGNYTFAIPEGTDGVGVVLIDNITGARTNLAIEDYTLDLAAGQYDGRFYLEISPIAQVPTSIENTDDSQNGNIRKVMVDGILYIVKDGKAFDAQGNRVK